MGPDLGTASVKGGFQGICGGCSNRKKPGPWYTLNGEASYLGALEPCHCGLALLVSPTVLSSLGLGFLKHRSRVGSATMGLGD